MAKTKRVSVGSVLKGKEGAPDYIKIRTSVTLKEGQVLNLQSAKQQREGVEKALKDGKMSEELAKKILERIDKIPDFVRFEVVLLTNEDQFKRTRTGSSECLIAQGYG